MTMGDGAGLARGALVAGLGLLAACGGGSAGNGFSHIAPPPPGQRTEFTYSNEYRVNYGLEMIQADAAYQRGATGLGVTVAVIDTGIDLNHADLQGRIDPRSVDVVEGRASGATVQDRHGHGTAVAGVIAAALNGQGMHGVAYDARVLAVRTDTDGGCGSGCQMRFSDLVKAIDYAVAQRVDIINLSIGSPSRGSADFEAALARAAAAGVLVVSAAGNSGGAEPEYPGRYAAAPFMAGAAIVVGAVDIDGKMASYSNRAGSTADRYLLAPGSRVETTRLNGGTGIYSGTSFAAPHAAGAAALVLDHAPHLTAKQVADILLSTATSYGQPDIHGRGLLNAKQALAPIGIVTVPLGDRADGPSAPLPATGLALAAAFGDAATGWDAPVLTLDSYGRPYHVPLAAAFGRMAGGATAADLVAGAPERPAPLGADETTALHLLPGDGTAARLDLRAGPDAVVSLGRGAPIGDGFGLAADMDGLRARAANDAFTAPHLKFAPSGHSAVATMRSGASTLRVGLAQGPDGSAFAAELGRPVGALRLSLQGGAVAEDGALMGGRGSGAVALDRSTSLFGTLQIAAPVADGITVVGQVAGGRTSFDGEGLLRDGRARTTALGIGVLADGVWSDGDRLGFTLSQPLRVDGGHAILSLPLSRTVDGQVVRETRRLALEPSGRQVDVGLSYGMQVGAQGQFGVDALLSVEPGHDAGAAPRAAVGLRYRTRF